MKFMGSILLVENMGRSREFYEKLLQQKVKDDFGVNVSFEGNFAIHLKTHFEEIAKLKDSGGVVFGSNSFDLCFETEEIDKLYHKLKNHQVEFLHEIEEQPWGQRVIRFYDPDKHIIEVGETMEGVVIRLSQAGRSMEEIVKKTAMSREFVVAALEMNR